MKLEFESNISAIEYVGNDSLNKIDSAKNLPEAAKMLEAGVKLAQEGRNAEARNFLLQATEADPENESAWLWLASVSEYPEELLVFLNSVLRINPNNERALEWAKATKSLLSKTFVQRGIDASKDTHKDFAKQCFLQAVVHDNRNETAWLWLASVSDSEEEKTAYLQKVLDVNPDNGTALFSLNLLKNQRAEAILQKAVRAAAADDYESALDTLEEISELEEAWVLKAYLARSFDEKLKCYEKVLELNPENDMAQANLIALLSLIEKAEAEEKTNVAQNLEPNEFAIEAAEEAFEQSVAEEAEEFSYPVENRNEAKVSPNELPTQKLEFPQDFSQPETAFDSPESAQAQFDLPETYEVSADVGIKSAENETESFAALERLSDEAEEFEYAEEDFSQSYSYAQSEIYAQPAEAENASYAAIESVEEIRAENQAAHFEENYAEDAETALSNSDEDSSNIYEIETGELSLADVMAEADYAPQFEESATDYSEENYFDFEESQPQPAAEFAAAQAENVHADCAATNKSQDEAQKPETEAGCPFCDAENEAQAFVCRSCRAALSLSDLETVLAHQEADKQTVENAVKRMEKERCEREFAADELKSLGVGYLNLKNLRKGLNCLKQAVQINPDDVVFSSQVNALAIRLAEIERQESIHSSMPQNRTILIVDDSATVRKLVSGKLEKSGHEVICAVDGIDALEKLQDTVPDLILLDINMPRMDGYQVCKLIRTNEATKDVPIVMISGKDGFFDKVRGRMAGTTGYITKPFGPETLMKTVEAYVVQQPVE